MLPRTVGSDSCQCLILVSCMRGEETVATPRDIQRKLLCFSGAVVANALGDDSGLIGQPHRPVHPCLQRKWRVGDEINGRAANVTNVAVQSGEARRSEERR